MQREQRYTWKISVPSSTGELETGGGTDRWSAPDNTSSSSLDSSLPSPFRILLFELIILWAIDGASSSFSSTSGKECIDGDILLLILTLWEATRNWEEGSLSNSLHLDVIFSGFKTSFFVVLSDIHNFQIAYDVMCFCSFSRWKCLTESWALLSYIRVFLFVYFVGSGGEGGGGGGGETDS